MRTKEIIVLGMTEGIAVKRLHDEFADYISDNCIVEWSWMIKPEAQKVPVGAKLAGQWRAYGRISYEVKKHA